MYIVHFTLSFLCDLMLTRLYNPQWTFVHIWRFQYFIWQLRLSNNISESYQILPRKALDIFSLPAKCLNQLSRDILTD